MVNWLYIPIPELFALLAAIGFAAGLNVYATVAVLGLLARFGGLPIPPALHSLTGAPVIVASVALFALEFIADKIPAFDLVWSALHTFVRVPVAALLAYGATRQLSTAQQLLATLLGAAVAFAAHGGKTAVRAAVTPSPEPLSNAALSFGEDTVAVGLTWMATHHPYLAGAITLCFVLVIGALARFVIRAVRALFATGKKSSTRIS